MKKNLKKLEDDRGKIYGDPFLSHQAIGLAWEGILRNRNHEIARFLNENRQNIIENNDATGNLFPADVVALFLAAFKTIRASRPELHEDSYDDNHIYLDFSERFRSAK